MMVMASFISGVMLGLEFDWDNKIVVLDLLIVRILCVYGKPDEEDEE